MRTKNAWMDTSTFMKWFDEIFYPCVRLRIRHPVEVNNHLQQEALSNDIDFRSILSAVEACKNKYSYLHNNKDELNSCIDTCNSLQRKLQHYNLATIQSENKFFTQMTMHDFFGHQ